MHPSNRDHKDMQKRGVPNISSEGWGQRIWEGHQGWAEMVGGGVGAGAHKFKEKRRHGIPGTVPLHLKWRRTAYVCIFGHTKPDPWVKDSIKRMQISCE